MDCPQRRSAKSITFCSAEVNRVGLDTVITRISAGLLVGYRNKRCNKTEAKAIALSMVLAMFNMTWKAYKTNK